MALSALARALGSLSLSASSNVAQRVRPAPLLSQTVKQATELCRYSSLPCSRLLLTVRKTSFCFGTQLQPWRGILTSAALCQNSTRWKQRTKYTIRPIGKKKTGGRDHTGKIRTHGIGGGHKQRYRMVDFQRLHFEAGKESEFFEEKVIEVRYDPCRSADIALVAGGSRKRWIIATENMQVGDVIKTSRTIGRMAVSANEGDSYPLGALPIGSLINNLEIYPGKGAQYVRAAGTCGVLLRKVNGTAIVQLPSKRQIQVLETCMATVGRVSNVDHNKRIIGKAGRNRWLGIRPSSGLWQRKGGWAGRKIKPIPPMKSYVNLPSAAAAAGTTS